MDAHPRGFFYSSGSFRYLLGLEPKMVAISSNLSETSDYHASTTKVVSAQSDPSLKIKQEDCLKQADRYQYQQTSNPPPLAPTAKPNPPFIHLPALATPSKYPSKKFRSTGVVLGVGVFVPPVALSLPPTPATTALMLLVLDGEAAGAVCS